MSRALFPVISVVVAGCCGNGRDHEAGVDTSKWLTRRSGGVCGGACTEWGLESPFIVRRSSWSWWWW